MKEKDALREAVAIKMGNGVQTPSVLAKGKGDTADHIIEKARENGIPVQEDPAMVELLRTIDVNESIPEELFEAVAEIFIFIHRLDREIGNPGQPQKVDF